MIITKYRKYPMSSEPGKNIYNFLFIWLFIYLLKFILFFLILSGIAEFRLALFAHA